MANPVVTAAVLVEANGAALNNSNEQIAGTDNTVSVKSIWSGGRRYPYVSGQAWRRWWRETLYADFGWTPSPVIHPDTKSAYTAADPVAYPDDDIFGYMAAPRRGRGEAGAKTQRRVSPLKNSLLISVLPNAIREDFAHFSRNLPSDNPNPVLFGFEHYSTYLQGVFTVSLTDAGRFEIGKMRDLPENYASDAVRIIEESGIKAARIPSEERRKRVAEALKALAQLRHGANLTRNLSDVAPVAVLIGFLDGGNAPFQRVFKSTDDGGNVQVNISRLTAVLSDYKSRLLDVENPVIFGALPGVLVNEDDVKALPGVRHAGSAADALSLAASSIQTGEWLTSIWG